MSASQLGTHWPMKWYDYHWVTWPLADWSVETCDINLGTHWPVKSCDYHWVTDQHVCWNFPKVGIYEVQVTQLQAVPGLHFRYITMFLPRYLLFKYFVLGYFVLYCCIPPWPRWLWLHLGSMTCLHKHHMTLHWLANRVMWPLTGQWRHVIHIYLSCLCQHESRNFPKVENSTQPLTNILTTSQSWQICSATDKCTDHLSIIRKIYSSPEKSAHTCQSWQICSHQVIGWRTIVVGQLLGNSGPYIGMIYARILAKWLVTKIS